MNIVKRCFTLGLIIGLTIMFSSCLDSPQGDDPNIRLQQDIATIDSYLISNSLVAEKDPYGLRMVIQTLGTGLPASFSNTVKVKYTGTLLSTGAVFDESPAYFVIPNQTTNEWPVIDGWKIALTTLPEGSKAKVYIPSVFAYGTKGQGTIGANEILVFEMEVLDIIRPAAYFTKIASDSIAIDNYLIGKGIYDAAVKDSTGIRYIITGPEGTGAKPSWFDKIKFKYTLKLLSNDAAAIESNTFEPNAQFYSRVVDYIDGLKIGFQQIKVGTKATFYIPSGLAYGSTSSTKIPTNSILIFEIELIDIVQ